MNKNGLMYDENYVSRLNEIDLKFTDNNSRVRELIKESGNYLIRDLLNLYGNDDIFDEVQKNESTPDYISYTFKTKKDEAIWHFEFSAVGTGKLDIVEKTNFQ